jgi:hypothetical protein
MVNTVTQAATVVARAAQLQYLQSGSSSAVCKQYKHVHLPQHGAYRSHKLLSLVEKL